MILTAVKPGTMGTTITAGITVAITASITAEIVTALTAEISFNGRLD